MRYIEDLREDEHLTEHYYCKQKQSFKTKAGKTYYSLRLQDKTGIIDAKIWELGNDIKNFEEGDFVKIDAVVSSYQDALQLKINRLRKSKEGEYDPLNYIPSTDKDVNIIHDEIMGYIKSMSNPFIRELTENILTKNNRIANAIKKHSAAKTMHHSYMGGLIEHTLSVAQICDFLAPRYKFVNRDMLVALAILHDLGKIYELSEFPENDYTDEGQLIGHIVIGYELIDKAAAEIKGFPDELKMLMKHCILAHHGEHEYGSPKQPKIIEAYILHLADNMDAKIKMFEEALSNDNSKGNWLGWQRLLERNIRKSYS
jgi:3'-5' exoribonuclease